MSRQRRHAKTAGILSLLLCFLLVFGTAAGEAYAAENRTGNEAAFEQPLLLDEEETAENARNTALYADSLMTQAGGLGRTTGGFPWDSENKSFSWTYYNGIMMDAFLMLNADAYDDDVIAFYNANISTQGQPSRYAEYELDSIPPTRALFDLLRRNDLTDLQRSKYLQCLSYVYGVMRTFEREYTLPHAEIQISELSQICL